MAHLRAALRELEVLPGEWMGHLKKVGYRVPGELQTAPLPRGSMRLRLLTDLARIRMRIRRSQEARDPIRNQKVPMSHQRDETRISAIRCLRRFQAECLLVGIAERAVAASMALGEGPVVALGRHPRSARELGGGMRVA